MSEDKKYHYYAFSFIDTNGCAITRGSVYIGFEDKSVTVPRINGAKLRAGVGESSVLLSVSYMGYMTSKECKG